jgi:hypothetical protein
MCERRSDDRGAVTGTKSFQELADVAISHPGLLLAWSSHGP